MSGAWGQSWSTSWGSSWGVSHPAAEPVGALITVQGIFGNDQSVAATMAFSLQVDGQMMLNQNVSGETLD